VHREKILRAQGNEISTQHVFEGPALRKWRLENDVAEALKAGDV